MRYLSVCSGIEAATVAWHGLGWKPAGFGEIEPFPAAVLRHHYPDVPNFGDMTKFKDWNTNGSIELLVGGTPCQSFSVAGLRKGLEDPRGNLALVYCGILDHFRPKWFVWENVPGVLSSNGGRDFGSFLGALAQLGYGFAYRVLDAQFFGVAQRRRRVFVVGYLGDWRPAATVLFERQSLRRDTAPRREAGEGFARTSGTLTANGGGLNRPFGNANELDFCIPTTGTLSSRSTGGGGLGTDFECAGGLLPVAARMVAFGEYADDGTASTCKARDYKDATDLVAQPIPLNSMTFGRENEKTTRQCLGVGEPGDPIPTLSKAHSHAVAQPITQYGEIAGSLTARYDSSPCADRGQNMVAQPIDFRNLKYHDGDVSGTMQAKATGGYSLNYMTGIQQHMAVRRLTPIECERLQGFPDNYTNIPWRKSAEAPDGPRYKALGNSMAVPVMRWIGQRIAMVDAIKQHANDNVPAVSEIAA